MSLLHIIRPHEINFLIENSEKTARLKLKWYIKHAKLLKKARTLNRKETGYTENDISLASIHAGLPVLTKDHVTVSYNRRRIPIRDGTHLPGVADLKKGHSIVNIGLADPEKDPWLNRPDTDTSLDPVMREVNAEQKNIIYQDVPEFGRAVYLKKRSKIPPEDRYYFPECTSWNYGWRMKDSELSKNRPVYGRKSNRGSV